MKRFLDRDEICSLGFRSYGSDILIDRAAVIINPENIDLGSRVRIDAFALIISGESGISLGSNIHIGSGAQIFGTGARVVLEDFSGMAPRSTLLSATDDFAEGYLTNPTVPFKYRNVQSGPIELRRHAVVGASSVVLPGVTIGWGATVGALSLVHKSVAELQCVFGCPARLVKTRSRERLEKLECDYLAEIS